MGAVGLEPTETEVEGFTVVCLTKFHNLLHTLQLPRMPLVSRMIVVDYGTSCSFLQANVPPLSHHRDSQSSLWE